MSSIGFNSNIAALIALRKVNDVTEQQSRIFERLASGLRINRASDDAAGLAIASSLSASARVYSQAIRNTNDGISALNIADGALSELSNVTIRLKELASQAANGSFSQSQRLSLQSESDTLVGEFNRIIGTTSFNGINLLNLSNSSLRIQQGYGASESLNLNIGSELDYTTGSGFATAGQVSFTSGATKTLTADIDGDGKIDLITSGAGGTKIALGNGDGTFGTASTIDATALTDFDIGDIDNDGDVDIVGNVSGINRVRVIRNNGSSSFVAGQYIAGVTPGVGITLGDTNGDGNLDVIQTFNSTSVGIQRGSGTGTFSAVSNLIIGANANKAIVRDIDGDGVNDLLFNGASQTNASLLVGTGSGNFAASAAIATGLATGQTNLALGDLNRDGKLDLVGTSNGRYSVLLGNGDGTFGAGTVTTPSNGTIANTPGVTIADLNKDGYLDLAFSSTTGGAYAYGNGNGTFVAPAALTGAATMGSTIAAADFNGDGVTDLAGASAGGLGSFVFLANATQTTNIAVLDLTSQANARSALDTLDSLFARINGELGVIGALQSRLDIGIRTLGSRAENYKAAEARILDVDVASESANLVRTDILKQSATAVLGQANQQPALALLLLKTF